MWSYLVYMCFLRNDTSLWVFFIIENDKYLIYIIGSTTTASTIPTTPEVSSTASAKSTQRYVCSNSSWFLHGANCYAVVHEAETFTNTKCSKYGMNLASIHSTSENHDIISWILNLFKWSNSQAAYPYFWIGLVLETGT